MPQAFKASFVNTDVRRREGQMLNTCGCAVLRAIPRLAAGTRGVGLPLSPLAAACGECERRERVSEETGLDPLVHGGVPLRLSSVLDRYRSRTLLRPVWVTGWCLEAPMASPVTRMLCHSRCTR
jgi:hypothetical protein